MRAGSVYGSYLKASDLQGRKIAVKIAAAEVAEFDDGKKIVLSFAGKDKKLPINMTNCNTITEILGTDETDHWIGHAIVLRPDRTNFAGKMVDCIRVEAYTSPIQAPPRAPARPLPPAPVAQGWTHAGAVGVPSGEGFDTGEPFVADDSDVPF